MTEVDDSHEFGSEDVTETKLRLLEEYIQAFATALRGKFPRIWYIDAFAGTGSRTIRIGATDANMFGEAKEETVDRKRGSARIALDVQPHFDRLIFMEQRKKHYDALMELRQQHPQRDIFVLQGDANDIIQSQLHLADWRGTRAVIFLDPYGMNVDWKTLECIAATGAIDVWYLFSLSGLFRQAARNISGIDQHKRAAITRMLGTSEWESELYQREEVFTDLFGTESKHERQRIADVAGLERYVTRRLRTIFPMVLEPFALPPVRRPQIFSLYFALSNKDPKAIGLAKKIAGHILNSGKPSHSRSR
ncbi:conserved hypothetical protein [Ancylobacter novellus DSM 506]|uniref:Three-Cys-motif partner protein TcmP n=1 Tax=Ancylobacter novellus (strain ATCC 8093 / DSM 506 / JCM 20403 / CCM 1077 / IAM 12100 / NBRC 12443 / NCIMB 10456) TaxID=639283 RepID=D7A2T2_ANCN5|nr:three-Cys-motif partner protein TcmP [Ancylobacter novellus]ADH91612.1 conserved hypothetical protein [Ancylobacter novellus DSM 506]